MKTANGPRLAGLFNALQRFNEKRVPYAIRNGFIAVMPAMIIGALATVLTSFPLPAYQRYMLATFGEGWTVFGELAYTGTTQIVTVLVVFAIGLNLGAWHNRSRVIHVREGICGLVSLGCYTIAAVPLTGEEAFPYEITGVNGMFVGMLSAVLATELFVAVWGKRQRRMVVSDDPNFAVSQSFGAVLPATLTLGAFVALRLAFVLLGYREGLTELLSALISKPLHGVRDSMLSMQLFSLASHVLWLFGIHGANVLDGMAQDVFGVADMENAAAVAAGLAPTHMATKTMFDAFVFMGGSGATLALLLALMLFGRRAGYRQLYAYAVPTGLFNINEPIIFGIPIVLNPVYAIPFVLVPAVMLGVTGLTMWLGLVPYTIREVAWNTPVFISGYLATGSVAGVVLQVVNLALATCLYAPFVRLNERLLDLRFKNSYEALTRYVVDEYDGSQRLMSRVDEIGAVARKLGSQLRPGLQKGNMYLVYQPIVDARTNTLHSAEALLRWNSAHNGPINPMLTVALAQEIRFMNELGLWILDEALRQRNEWNLQGLPDFHISVNAAPTQLEDGRFAERVQELLAKHTVPPHQLQIEITETAALTDSAATRQNLQALAAMGVNLAMDDFGVGHSSLLYLRTQPIGTLKVDAALSTDIVENPHSLSILITIRDLCKQLGVETIVEHVDNQTQLDLLLEVDAYLIQGYYFSPPLVPNEFEAYLGKLASMRRFPGK